MLVVLSLGSGFKIASSFYQKEKLREINDLKVSLQNLKDTLNVLTKEYQKLRILAGLKPDNEAYLKMGIGGGVDESDFQDPVEKEIYRTSGDIERLLALTRYELVSFEKIKTELLRTRDKWARIPSIKPVNGFISSRYGYRIDPFTGKVKFHRGIDIVAPVGTPVIAPARGRVRSIRWHRGYGLSLEIDHGNGIRTFYAHLSRVKVRKWQMVERGDTIAFVGNTGRSTGPHLHYEVRVHGVAVNPLRYIIPDYAFYE